MGNASRKRKIRNIRKKEKTPNDETFTFIDGLPSHFHNLFTIFFSHIITTRSDNKNRSFYSFLRSIHHDRANRGNSVVQSEFLQVIQRSLSDRDLFLLRLLSGFSFCSRATFRNTQRLRRKNLVEGCTCKRCKRRGYIMF